MRDFEKICLSVVLGCLLTLASKSTDVMITKVYEIPSFELPFHQRRAMYALYGPDLHEKASMCKSDYQCSTLAEAIVYEARSESWQGAIAVGYVVVERSKNPNRWPNDIAGVVSEGCQFSYRCWQQGRKPLKKDWQRGYVTAWDILNNKVDNPIGKSDHYHTIQVKPSWSKKMTYVATIGNHKFYKER